MIIGYRNNVPQKITIKRPCQGYYLRWYYNGWHYWFFYPGTQSLITEGEKYRTIGTKSVIMGTGQITFDQCQAVRTIMNTREVYILTSDGWKHVSITPGSVVVYDNQVNGYEVELSVKIGSKEISQTGFSPIVDVPIIPIPDPGLCEVTIGTQIWMCKNYDSDFPGSKVYNNDEANRIIYGGLYTYDQVKTNGFCPSGWHVPTTQEWDELITYIGGDVVAGGKLKEIGFISWDAPNTDADNSSGFTAKGAGYAYKDIFTNILIWAGLKTYSYFRTASDYDENGFNDVRLLSNNNAAVTRTYDLTSFLSIRLIKDTPALSPPIFVSAEIGTIDEYTLVVTFDKEISDDIPNILDSSSPYDVGPGLSVISSSKTGPMELTIILTGPALSGELYTIQYAVLVSYPPLLKGVDGVIVLGFTESITNNVP